MCISDRQVRSLSLVCASFGQGIDLLWEGERSLTVEHLDGAVLDERPADPDEEAGCACMQCVLRAVCWGGVVVCVCGGVDGSAEEPA